MSVIKVGALFAGYSGIELALAQVAREHPGVAVQLAWYCEIDPAASKILAHRYPGVPNHGSVTEVDWASVEPVDIITGGSPCQDLSTAGNRQGMTDGTRSNLWVAMREAIAVIRPRLVVWENVRGAGSAQAASAMEQCPRCMGSPTHGKPVLRALGRVVGDLADLRYDARWYGLRAADVGGAHARFRYFLFATPADAEGSGQGDAIRKGGLPLQHRGVGGPLPRGDIAPHLADARLGAYGRTVERWARVVGRPAPSPIDLSHQRPKVSARFQEWLMGLPDGWVTAVPGLSLEEQLKALGNGVVPQQCAAALRAFIHDTQASAA